MYTKLNVFEVNPFNFDYNNNDNIKTLIENIKNINTDYLQDIKNESKSLKYYHKFETKSKRSKRYEKGYKISSQLDDEIQKLNNISFALLRVMADQRLKVDNILNDLNNLYVDNIYDAEKNVFIEQEQSELYKIKEQQNEKEFELMDDLEQLYKKVSSLQYDLSNQCASIKRIVEIPVPKRVTIDTINDHIKRAKSLLSSGNRKSHDDLMKAHYWNMTLGKDLNELDRISMLITAQDNITSDNKRYRSIIEFFDNLLQKEAYSGTDLLDIKDNKQYQEIIGDNFFEANDSPQISNPFNKPLKNRKNDQLKIIACKKLEVIQTKEAMEEFLVYGGREIKVEQTKEGYIQMTISKSHNIDENNKLKPNQRITAKLFDNDLVTKYTFNPTNHDIIEYGISTMSHVLAIDYNKTVDENLKASFKGFIGQLESALNINFVKLAKSNTQTSLVIAGGSVSLKEKKGDIELENKTSIKLGEITSTQELNNKELPVQINKIKVTNESNIENKKIKCNISKITTSIDILNKFNAKSSLANGFVKIDTVLGTFKVAFIDNIKEFLTKPKFNKKEPVKNQIEKVFNSGKQMLEDIEENKEIIFEKSFKNEYLYILNDNVINKMDIEDILQSNVSSKDIDLIEFKLKQHKEPEKLISIIRACKNPEIRQSIQQLFEDRLTERVKEIVNKEDVKTFEKIYNSSYSKIIEDLYNTNIDINQKCNMMLKEKYPYIIKKLQETEKNNFFLPTR